MSEKKSPKETTELFLKVIKASVIPLKKKAKPAKNPKKKG